MDAWPTERFDDGSTRLVGEAHTAAMAGTVAALHEHSAWLAELHAHVRPRPPRPTPALIL